MISTFQMSPDRKTVRILGTHGVPANYGGFETAAENIALFLRNRGWRVIVYCQTEGDGPMTYDTWNDVERVTIPVDLPGWKGTSRFDWLSIRHACQFKGICLTFGYNTGIYNLWQRLYGITNIINMDGIEWARSRWGFIKQAILYINERFAALYGTHLIADHPEIESYLWTRAPKRKISTITYGANPIKATDTSRLETLGLQPGAYITLIARPIPENMIAELVEGFSVRTRSCKLVVLGSFKPEQDPYHARVMALASDEVLFPGAIYDKTLVETLRFHGLAYLHGHTVGGTNPSLVEAMAAGNAVIANDNKYNRWVAGEGALYFTDAQDIDKYVSLLLGDEELRNKLSVASLARFESEFTWERVAGQYETLLSQYLEPEIEDAAVLAS